MFIKYKVGNTVWWLIFSRYIWQIILRRKIKVQIVFNLMADSLRSVSIVKCPEGIYIQELHHKYCIISERFLDTFLKKIAKQVSTKQMASRQQLDKITYRRHQEFCRTTCSGRSHMVLYATPRDVLYWHPEDVPYCWLKTSLYGPTWND